MLFNIFLRVDFFYGLSPSELQEAKLLADSIILPICKTLDIECNRSIYHFHLTEADEVAGKYYDGCSYDLHRNVKHVHNYYHLAKIFEGLSALIAQMGDPILDSEVYWDKQDYRPVSQNKTH